MFNKITSIFKQLIDDSELNKSPDISPNLAIACLLCEVAGADHHIDNKELNIQHSLLKKLLSLSAKETNCLLEKAQTVSNDSTSLYAFTSQLRALSQQTRYELIKSMWDVAYADGHLDPIEEAVIRKTAELLYVDHSEFIRAKLQSDRNINK